MSRIRQDAQHPPIACGPELGVAAREIDLIHHASNVRNGRVLRRITPLRRNLRIEALGQRVQVSCPKCNGACTQQH
jgi:hypothetical protein